jgi:hypothetical protein
MIVSTMKTFLSLLTLVAWPALAADFAISSFSAHGTLRVENAFTNGVVTVEKALALEGPWWAEQNAYSLAGQAQFQLAASESAAFFRALAVDLSGRGGYTNLFQSYGVLSTVAGSGNIACISCNSWQNSYEGGLATNAALSSPHIAMADRAGNLYIADKRAHAIRKVTPDGFLYTVAGTSVGGYGTTDPAPATSVQLNNPNGLFVFANGMFYVLDRDNGLIRKVDTNGIMTTVVNQGSPISGGRGLWVSSDETLLYYAAGSTLMRWDATNGLVAWVNGFTSLGNIAMDPTGHLVVTDDRHNRVYRIEADGSTTAIAGNGGSSGGGDGALATETALYQVRGIWFLPTGGCFLATDAACQVWYVDPLGYIHLVLNGSSGAHSGDGAWFYDNPGTAKISNGKQITLDYDGNLIITESEYGYVRKIQFLRHDSSAD